MSWHENYLLWLQKWYVSQCNGDWEHAYGIKLYSTLDRGWHLVIDLECTNYKVIELPFLTKKINEKEWFQWEIKDSKFIGTCTPTELSWLIYSFKESIENFDNSRN